MKFAVVIGVGDNMGEVGNLALADSLRVAVAEPGPDNNYKGEFKPITQVLGVEIWLSIRAPVFKIGEILLLNEEGRDQFGRKPEKWDVSIVGCSTMEQVAEMVERAIEEAALAKHTRSSPSQSGQPRT